MKGRGSKWHNIPTVYGGVKYHSKLEAKHAAELDLLLKAKKIKRWERQVRISLNAYGETICVYVVDFLITHLDGKTEYLESKGKWTAAAKIKWALFSAMMKHYQPESILTVRYK